MRRSQTDGRCVFFRVRRKSRARYAAFRRALHFSNSSNAGSRGASLFMNCGDLGGGTDGTTRRPSTWVLLAETRVISYSSIINKCRPRTFPGRRLNSSLHTTQTLGPGKTVSSKHATQFFIIRRFAATCGSWFWRYCVRSFGKSRDRLRRQTAVSLRPRYLNRHRRRMLAEFSRSREC